jgi:glucose-1-phosphate cytidylyltransferase
MDNNSSVHSFMEKPHGDGNWINGGFFVLEPSIVDYIDDDKSVWERKPLESIAQDNELMAFKHHGFWKPMDTLRDNNDLETLWDRQEAPWKLW